MRTLKSLAFLALLGVAPVALAQGTAVHKAKNLEYAKPGQSVFLADPTPLKNAKVGDKIKLVDASNAKITGDGTITTPVVKETNGVKTWVGWSVIVDSIRK
jgi:hypothetical protein